MIRSSESTQNLSKALIECAPEITSVAKSREAKTTKFTYRYATLDGVIDILRAVLPKHGLWFVQMPETDEGRMYLRTRVIHTSGEWIEFAFAFDKTEGGGGVANEAQKIGISITYFRRYILSSIFGIAADDDTDGVQPVRQQQSRPAPTAQPQTERRDPLSYILQVMGRMMKDGEKRDSVLKGFADILKTDAVRSPERMSADEQKILATELWKQQKEASR